MSIQVCVDGCYLDLAKVLLGGGRPVHVSHYPILTGFPRHPHCLTLCFLSCDHASPGRDTQSPAR